MTAPFWDGTGDGYEQGVGLFDWSPWDICKLAGQTLPGLCTVSGDGSKRELDVKAASGQSGATITHKGYPPQDITIVLRMWLPEQIALFEAIVPLIAPRPGKKPSAALTLDHPATSLFGINAMMVETVSLPADASPKGVKSVTIKGKAWGKPVKTGTNTPKTAKGGGLPPTVLDNKNAAWDQKYRTEHPGDNGPPPPPPPSFTDAGPP